MSLFCPDCGSLMMPHPEGRLCSNCQVMFEPMGKKASKEYSTTIKQTEREMAIYDAADPAKVKELAEKGIWCPKGCGQTMIFEYQRQTRRADEPPTNFYRCGLCGAARKRS